MTKNKGPDSDRKNCRIRVWRLWQPLAASNCGSAGRKLTWTYLEIKETAGVYLSCTLTHIVSDRGITEVQRGTALCLWKQGGSGALCNFSAFLDASSSLEALSCLAFHTWSLEVYIFVLFCFFAENVRSSNS